MTRASGTMRGSAVSTPGTSFQRETSRAPSARASSVAVRSEPPRPSVTACPSGAAPRKPGTTGTTPRAPPAARRSEEHTSELQSRSDLVCRLLLEKKKKLIKQKLRHPPLDRPHSVFVVRL